MRVFVLSPGRSGSATFTEACRHMTNYTAGHETRSDRVKARFDYPDNHIEVDNRLTWMLGGLGAASAPEDRFVWLRRDSRSVIASFLGRWEGSYRASIIKAFAHGIIQRRTDWDDREAVVRFYVETVEANIAEFVKARDHMVVRLGTSDFDTFWDWIDARGDRDAAVETWARVHNASESGSATDHDLHG
jgi:hypothetical protein